MSPELLAWQDKVKQAQQYLGGKALNATNFPSALLGKIAQDAEDKNCVMTYSNGSQMQLFQDQRFWHQRTATTTYPMKDKAQIRI